MWYEQDAEMAPSKKHFISTDIGPMSVDVADVDGDLDVIVVEHDLSNSDERELFRHV